EFEYVRYFPADDALAPGGFTSDRFYFRGFDIPYDRSEWTVVVPRGMPLVVDPRGEDAPHTERSERGPLEVYHWIERQSHRIVREPHGVDSTEFMPSINVGS